MSNDDESDDSTRGPMILGRDSSDEEEVVEPNCKKIRIDNEDEYRSNWRHRLDQMIREKKEEKEAKQKAKDVEDRRKRNAEKNALGDHGLKKTYGKGYALLKKMGYSGGGLGKEGSGIANPLLVKIREKNRGLQNWGESVHERELPAHEKLSSFQNSCSAIDILLGDKRKTDESKKEKPNLRSSGRWRKGASRDIRLTYKTAAEIATESRIRHRDLTERIEIGIKPVEKTQSEMEIIEEDSDSETDNEDWGEYDNKEGLERRQSSKKERLRRQQAQLRLSLHSTGYSEPAAPAFRIVDMTGPSKRVINDVQELRVKLIEATEEANRSTMFGSDFGEGEREFSLAARQTDSDVYEFHPTGEIKSIPRRKKEDDSVEKIKLLEDEEHNKDEKGKPLQELQHNLTLCVSCIEAEIAQKAKDKIYYEGRFQKSLEREGELEEKVASLKRQSEIVENIVNAIKQFRNSLSMKYVFQYLSIQRRITTRCGDAKGHSLSADALRIRADDMNQRQAAILKYASEQSELEIRSTSAATPKGLSDDESGMKFSDDDSDDDAAAQLWKTSCNQRQSESFALSADSIVSSMQGDNNPIDLKNIDPPSAYELLVDLTSLFKSLLLDYHYHYNILQLPTLASQFALCLISYSDSIHLHQQLNISHEDPLLLISLLFDFRDQCLVLLPPELQTPTLPHFPSLNPSYEICSSVQDLRELWQKRLDHRITEALRTKLKYLVIDPTAQDLRPLQSVLQWAGPIPIDTIVQLLDTEFFPKWIKVLKFWLNSPTLDLEEIHIWYTGWKSFFPPPFCYHPLIEAQFLRGLQLINAHLQRLASVATVPVILESHTATEMSELPSSLSSPPPPPVVSPPPPPSEEATSASATSSVRAASSASRLSSTSRFMEALQALAEENNVIMIPKKGRTQNGKQVYSFGPLSIYVDTGIIYTLSKTRESDNHKWEIVSLADLLRRASKRQ